MNLFLSEIVYILLLLIPTFAIVFSIARERSREAARWVLPFDELQKRPAGESTRLQLEKYSEKLNEWLLGISAVPVVFALGLTFQKQTTFVSITLFFLVVAVFAAVAQRRIRWLLDKRRRYRLGFEGERYVAAELNELMADGFRVFHDVPFDKYNLDHVLVGPSGVFVVETKTRRKPISDKGKKQYKVIFDGEALRYPTGRDTDGLDQLRRNQQSLSKWLSAATADRIDARGILTIPGWWVEQTARADVQCLNPGQIRAAVLATSKSVMTPQQIQRVSHQLMERSKLSINGASATT
jgi:hypothetical protein